MALISQKQSLVSEFMRKEFASIYNEYLSMTKYISAKQILKAYEAGIRNFEGLDMDDEDHDFSGSHLAGASFCGSFLVATFRDCNLQDADFSNTNIKTCDFSGANLTRAKFCSAGIDGTEFTGAILDGTTFEGACEQGHIYGRNEMPIRNYVELNSGMQRFLFVFGYESPEECLANKKGSDFESSDALWVRATTNSEALSKGRVYANEFVARLYGDANVTGATWVDSNFAHWISENPLQEFSQHDLDSFHTI